MNAPLDFDQYLQLSGLSAAFSAIYMLFGLFGRPLYRSPTKWHKWLSIYLFVVAIMAALAVSGVMLLMFASVHTDSDVGLLFSLSMPIFAGLLAGMIVYQLVRALWRLAIYLVRRFRTTRGEEITP